MYFTTLLVTAALVPWTQAAPAVGGVPGVAIANSDVSAEAAISDEFIIVYKEGTSKDDIKKYEADTKAKMGKAPKATYNIPDFQAIQVQTDAIGLAKIAKSPIVSR